MVAQPGPVSRAALGFLVAAVLGGPTDAGAVPGALPEGLDVAGWLRRPGVRLVAVELYATWCAPCVAAVPRWAALHDKLRGRGVRLLVVRTQDPGGKPGGLAWRPDQVIADDDGKVAAALGAGDRLPASFLWSWRGQLLVERGGPAEVEKAAARWLEAAPAVAVEAAEVPSGAGIDAGALSDLVRGHLRDLDKLAVVASPDEQARLRKLRADWIRNHDSYDETAACEMGKELPANTLLVARITGEAAERRLGLSLFAAETGCLVASALVPWQASLRDAGVGEAVAALLGKLASAPRMPAPPAPSATLRPAGRPATGGGAPPAPAVGVPRPPTHQCKDRDVADCTAECDRGHAGSCRTLGEMYSDGQGVPRDRARAMELYRRACEGGSSRACLKLGAHNLKDKLR